ncbi:hypothetical protein E3P99_02992 [Wallemia hederae]|uniref:Superoxide dismutase copper/zinc binding domain-containing protein n=1 Tax=Wallemia hederae TaxID=1540922 RepID=A0A4V4LSX3_9BASI|nr:hypothetical protein E3P99_02992 [Wallemia hederae]
MLFTRIAALSLVSALASSAAVDSRQLDNINDSISSAMDAYNGGNQPKQQDTTQQKEGDKAGNSDNTSTTRNDSIDWKKADQIAHAKFDDKVKGTVKFGGDWSKPTDVEIEIKEGLEEHKKYKWSINVHPVTSSSDCNSAGDILNPVSVPENVVCDPKKPEYCKLGDLSGKHGALESSHGGGACTEHFEDDYVRFFPQPFSLLGRSVVITDDADKRIACANIISMLDGTQKEKGSFEATGTKSTYQDDYREPTRTGEGEAKVTPFRDGKTVDQSKVPPKPNPAVEESPSVDPGFAVLDSNDSSGALSASHVSYRFVGLTIVSAMLGAVVL